MDGVVCNAAFSSQRDFRTQGAPQETKKNLTQSRKDAKVRRRRKVKKGRNAEAVYACRTSQGTMGTGRLGPATRLAKSAIADHLLLSFAPLRLCVRFFFVFQAVHRGQLKTSSPRLFLSLVEIRMSRSILSSY